MSVLSKLTVKTITRASKQDPVQLRRRKLVAAIEEQMNVAAAASNGESYEMTRKTWVKNEQGEKVLVDKLRKVRPWFFEQDGGWYVQCKYGNKALTISGGNAVFVKALKDVAGALDTLKAATEAGELDEAIENIMKNRGKKVA
ncbi:hypothetical protein [Ruegeria halocynthiae]|uniref:hypothetical protein n=1 Tax=Ruegeria halocynthiae TaxID=985054 RepID=UPI00055DD6B8|nr:hypothetical protein [Ruegeria halocynthiae]